MDHTARTDKYIGAKLQDLQSGYAFQIMVTGAAEDTAKFDTKTIKLVVTIPEEKVDGFIEKLEILSPDYAGDQKQRIRKEGTYMLALDSYRSGWPAKKPGYGIYWSGAIGYCAFQAA